tara:strand:+ start:49 stop:606 length:558 start_codon:yes stop_codon:yes gene_type:complete
MFKAYFYLLCAVASIILMFFSIQSTWAETNTVSSTVVNNTPPTANAPVLPNSNNDICKIGVGGAVQNNVLGIATGVLIDDELCQKLKLSRSMYAYGMKVAAVSILCQDPRVWSAMTDAGTPCPVQGLIGAEAAQYWEDNPDQIPDGSKYKPEYLQTKKESEPKGDSGDLKNFGLLVLSLLLFAPL